MGRVRIPPTALKMKPRHVTYFGFYSKTKKDGYVENAHSVGAKVTLLFLGFGFFYGEEYYQADYSSQGHG